MPSLRLFFHHQRHLGLGYEVKQIIRDQAPLYKAPVLVKLQYETAYL